MTGTAYRACGLTRRGVAVALAVLFASPAWAADEPATTPLAGTTPAQWRLIWTEDPQSRATISWSTAEAGRSHRVHYDTRSHKDNLAAYRFRADSNANGRYTAAANEALSLHYHHAELTGLKPATTYYFRIVSDEAASREFHFITAPDADVPVKVIYGADSRTGHSTRRRMNRLIATLAGRDKTVLAFVHGGDYVWRVWTRGGLSRFSRWMSDHELTVTADGRMLPIIPIRGDHELSGPQVGQVFGWPGGGRFYWHVRLTPQVLLVALNTNGPISTDANQVRFLDRTLRANAKMRWKLAAYHKPAYPGVKDRPSPARKLWVPLFEKYGLAMVCEADGHLIKRTVPIQGDKPAADGVVYIGEGGLGAPLRTPNTDRWYMKPPAKCGRAYHIQVLSFGKTALKYEVLLSDGSVFDTYEIKARPQAGGKSSP
ncbi:MAG TPA: fibronectin type III domain-containing protein [Phycisphaerae bacterium]|nr:fibronectin type III domain-containing protein [Phycisphaerae bacterium]